MANKVLSIEIGPQITRVAELDYKTKNQKIYNTFTFATPPNMLADGIVNASACEIFAALLKRSISQHRVSTKKVIFVIRSSRIVNRIVQIPNVKENRIDDLLKSNASDYFPIDLSQYELAHEVLGTVDNGGEKKLQLSVLAVPKEIVGSYEKLAAACGLAFVGLDYMGNAVKKLMVQEIPEEIKATICVDEESTVITIVENGAVQLQRTVNYGISDALDSVSRGNLFGNNLDANESLKVLNRRACIYSRFDEAVIEEEATGPAVFEVDAGRFANLRAEITDNFRTLVGSISRIFDYYQSRNAEAKLEKIYLVGFGSVCTGLHRLLSNELNYEIVSVRQLGDINVAKSSHDNAAHMSEFFTCIGAAIDPISIPLEEKKGEKKVGGEGAKAESGKDSYTIPILVGGICVIAAIALIVYALVSSMMLKAENTRLKGEVSRLEYIEEIVAEYDAAKADNDWAHTLENATSSHNDNLVAFIEELEQKMPTEINVLTVSAGENSVSLNIEVSSKSAVADIISQLRTFDSVTVGNVSTIAEQEDDAGVKVVSFSVECAYVDPVESTEAQETQETQTTTEETDGTIEE